jgi:hypothetical protein
VSANSIPEHLEGWIPALATEDEIRAALEQALNYRGDVTITRKDGNKVEGYLFDRRTGKSLEDSVARVLPEGSSDTISIPYADIAALAFTGRDPAAGKSWEAWVRKYHEKRAAGERGFGIDPELLDG